MGFGGWIAAQVYTAMIEIQPCETCRTLLSEGLDLCVRARKMDAQHRANATVKWSAYGEEWEKSGAFKKCAEMNNRDSPHKPMATKSATMYVWMQEQYDLDLHAWDKRSREHLLNGCKL